MGKKLTQGEVDKVLAEVGFVPEEGWVYKNGKAKIPGRWLHCEHENPSLPTYSNVLSGNSKGCKDCGGRGKNTQAQVDKVLLDAGFTPEEGWTYKSHTTPIPGRWNHCEHANPSFPRYSHIVRGLSTGCLKCVALTQTEVDKVLLDAGFVPEDGWAYKNVESKIPGRWLHCEHENPSLPRYTDIANGGSRGCTKCRGLLKQFTQEQVDKILLEVGFTPKEGWTYEGTEYKIPGVWDACGHAGTPQYSNITRRDSRCLVCGWVLQDGPTHVYLLHHAEFRSIKVGITLVDSMRLTNFKRSGWKLVASNVVEGHVAAGQCESRIFASLVSAGHSRSYLSADLMPAGGHTETFAEDALDTALELLHEESKQLIG